MSRLVLGLPSKGRLREQSETWMAQRGLTVVSESGRGYAVRLEGLDGIELRLASAAEIAGALLSGDMHVGITGEDLLRENSRDMDRRIELLSPLGFGRADLVVAVPRAWVDVTLMSDLADIAERMRTQGRRLRVATKYLGLAHRFFYQKGVMDHRIVESLSATEGAPAAGLAEVIVDITSSGQTLVDNHLKILEDGLILRSEAQLAASRIAGWSREARAARDDLLARIKLKT